MSTQIRRRNLLRLIGVYTPRGKPKILNKKAVQIFLHVGTQRITSTQIRRYNLLQTGPTPLVRKPTILNK